MRRADRLFRIVSQLRRRRVITARGLAEALEVSERTVYRDIRDLVRSGVPITGEAGVGYALGKGWDLPPLMFSAEELSALVLGVRVVSSWGDDALAGAARSVLEKVEVVASEAMRAKIAGATLFAPSFHVPAEVRRLVGDLRKAIEGAEKVALDYRDGAEKATRRRVRPLALFYWGSTWSLAAWCELREDFRAFRLDRMVGVERVGETFVAEQGKTYEDFRAHLARQDAGSAPTPAPAKPGKPGKRAKPAVEPGPAKVARAAPRARLHVPGTST
jgi:predicted DNA-binding transcriptional regulator YafY